MSVLLEIEYLTPDKKVVNVHIRHNDVFFGQEAVAFIKSMINGLFQSGVSIILANTPKGKEHRHVRLFNLQLGMKKVMETENTIIYHLKGSE